MKTAPTKIARLVPALVLVALLSGCGFHLRSALQLPADLGPVAVTAVDPYSPLADTLARAMERAGTTPAATGALDGATRLEILSEKWADLPIAVDAQGRAQEYSLRYAVVFRLRKADDTMIVPQQAVELSRDYIAPPADSIGRNSERELLVGEMRRDMSASILRRIDAALRASGKTP
ncbi:MAG: LPS assembly lipoprotein LptE [Pseudomonadota bacterium]